MLRWVHFIRNIGHYQNNQCCAGTGSLVWVEFFVNIDIEHCSCIRQVAQNQQIILSSDVSLLRNQCVQVQFVSVALKKYSESPIKHVKLQCHVVINGDPSKMPVVF